MTSAPPLKQASDRGLTLRPETPDDRPFTTRLYASVRRDELAAVAWSEADKDIFLRQQHDAQHSHYRQHYPTAGWFIVQHNDIAVGRLYLVHWASETRIIDIALVPEARRNGFGTALIADVLAEACAAARAVSIHVERMNPALSLYRRLGFETAEDRGVYLLLESRPGQVKIAS